MNEDAFNLSVRKFLKQFGVTAQREIERAVQRGLAGGTLRGEETISGRATLVVEGLVRDFHIDGEVTLRDRVGRATVGEGWVVLMAPRAYVEVAAWAPRLTRGGLVRRQVGWYGDDKVYPAHGLLPLPQPGT